MNSSFDITIIVDSGNQNVASYGFDIHYDGKIIDATVTATGADGFLAAANTDNYGTVAVAGFDASGVGPGIMSVLSEVFVYKGFIIILLC